VDQAILSESGSDSTTQGAGEAGKNEKGDRPCRSPSFTAS